MRKYIIIRQDVLANDVDDMEILPGIYDTLEKANDKLLEIYDLVYHHYHVKLIQRDYLFCWDGYDSVMKSGYTFTKRIYYRIKEIYENR